MQFEPDRFVSELAAAIGAVLRRNAAHWQGKTLACLAIDVHPWSGFLNLSMRQINDSAMRDKDDRVCVADWELSHFAVAHDLQRTTGWPEAHELAARMKAAFAAMSAERGDDAATRFFYVLCAKAARDEHVWSALVDVVLEKGFAIVVPNVDSPRASLEVRSAAASKTVRDGRQGGQKHCAASKRPRPKRSR